MNSFGEPGAIRWHEHRPTPMAIAVLVIGTAIAVWKVIRARLVNWGATNDEVSRTLPGDELIPNSYRPSTMGITIKAPPEQVWPWIIQMGVDRAGLYSSLFIENTVLRLGVTNADQIHPEWQDLKVGDHIWFVPEDYPTPRFGPTVASIEPNRSLVLIMGEPDGPAPGTWQFVLDGVDDNTTRLILRQRNSADEPLIVRLPNLVLEPGYFVMSRKMLFGIKERAEQVPTQESPRQSLGAQATGG